jgi:hypothetical protein
MKSNINLATADSLQGGGASQPRHFSKAFGADRDGISRSYSTAFLLLMIAAPAWAQSVAITSPANGATIQAVNLTNGRALPILVSVTEGSGNHTYRVCAAMNGRPINPQNCSVAAPWTVMAFPGLPGDGDEVYQVTSYDIFGNVLATSAAVTIHARLIGLVNSITAAPASGSGTISVNAWGGRTFGGACPGTLTIDGKPTTLGVDYTNSVCTSTGINFQGFDTTKWRNGNHEIYVTLNDSAGTQTGGDPFLMGNTFAAGGISGSTVTLTAPQNHWLVTNRPVYFTTTGTLPTPLIAGAFWGAGTSATSTTNTVVSAVSTGGSTVVTLNASPRVSIGGFVDVRNWVASNTEIPACEGSFIVTAASGNTFTYANTACPNGTATQNPAIMAVVTNAYYAIFASNTTAQFATAPNGSAITFGGGSTGTHTVASRISAGYWRRAVGDDGFDDYPVAFARKVVDFENGATPMEIRPPSWQYERVTGFVGDTVCPTIVNTDGTTSTATCTSGAYTVVPDGGFSNVVTVAANGAISYVNPGYAKITVAYSGFQAVTIYVHAYTGAVTFDHFTVGGSIGHAYVKGSSFIPTSAWFMDCLAATPNIAAVESRALWLGSLMNDSGINSCFGLGLGTNIFDPINAGPCESFPTTADSQLRAFMTANGIKSSEGEMQYLGWPPWRMSSFINNTGWNRQACVQAHLADIKADGRMFSLFSFDEIPVGFSTPVINGSIGGPNWTNVSFSGGVATFNVSMALETPDYTQSTGLGASVSVSGAVTNTCLNNWYKVTGRTTGAEGITTSFTAVPAATVCANGTYTSATDAPANLNYLWSNGKGGDGLWVHAGVLPKYIGAADWLYQSWSTVSDGAGNSAADTTLTSVVSNGSTCTIHDTGAAFAEGRAVFLTGATRASLNTMGNIHVVDGNTFTFPCVTAAGTYTSSTDANLLLSYDAGLPNNYLAQVSNILHAGGDIALRYGILGSWYGYTPATLVKNWNVSSIQNGALDYHAQAGALTYGDDVSVYITQLANQDSGLKTRAFQLQARGALLESHGMQYLKQRTGYLFDPSLDNANSTFWRPETMAANISTSITWGESAFRLTWYQNNNSGQYALPSGSLVGGAAIGPENAKMWASMGRTFQLSGHLDRYILQPHANAPYLGPMFSSMASTSSYGNLLWITCLVDGGSTYQQTVDLSGIRQAGGSIYRISHTGYRTIYTALAGSPTGDTYNFCAAGAGETVVYVAQPSGATSDLTSTTFVPPATLPYAASHYAVRYGYYPRDMMDDPVQPCDAGCTIGLHRVGGPAWFQTLYLDSHNVPLAIGDATKLPGN